jgi:hypothetical protein
MFGLPTYTKHQNVVQLYYMVEKQLIELTKADLAYSPVWKCWTDKGVEFVSATQCKSISGNSCDNHIVLTEFVLNNGAIFTGFCSPQDPSGLDYIQPVLFTQNGQVNLHQENAWDNRTEQTALSQIGLAKESVFPIKYQTKIKCDNKFYSGRMLDFNKQE